MHVEWDFGVEAHDGCWVSSKKPSHCIRDIFNAVKNQRYNCCRRDKSSIESLLGNVLQKAEESALGYSIQHIKKKNRKRNDMISVYRYEGDSR